jgi:hypothetical protein
MLSFKHAAHNVCPEFLICFGDPGRTAMARRAEISDEPIHSRRLKKLSAKKPT